MASISSLLKSLTSTDTTLENRITTLLNQLNFIDDDSILKSEDYLSKHFLEIIETLQQLKQYLSEKSNNNNNDCSSFTELKDVYRLLDCLSQVNSLTLHSDINRLVMECIFNIYDYGCLQPTETRTRSWVISKLRNCLMYVDAEEKSVFDQLGLHTGLICEKAISVLRQYIINLKINTDTVNGKPVPNGVFMSSDSLSDVCSILIYLLHNSQQSHVQTLVDVFMDYLSTRPCSGVVLDFYRKLDSLESSIYAGSLTAASPPPSGYLSFYSRYKLWISYMPSLEREILSLIRASVEWSYCRKHMERIINSRFFPEACAQDTQLFLETSNIFHSVVEKMVAMDEKNITVRRHCGGAAIVNVLSVFYDSVHRHTTEYSCREDTMSLFSLYPSFLHEILKQYTRIPYQDISECVRNMKSFFQQTEIRRKCAGFDLVHVWVQTQHFRLKFIAYLLKNGFTVPEENLDSWLTTLLWFYQIDLTSANYEHKKDLLCRFIKGLRLVFCQCSPTWNDIKHILPPAANVHSGSVLVKSVVDSLLLTFAVYSKVDMSFVDRALQFIADSDGNNSTHSHLVLLLSAETLLHFEPNYSLKAVQCRYVSLIIHYQSMWKEEKDTRQYGSRSSAVTPAQILIGCEDIIKDYS